jgi:ribosome modulation factor
MKKLTDDQFTEIHEEGYQAYLEGLPISECPYDQESEAERAVAWEGGWMVAEEEENPNG